MWREGEGGLRRDRKETGSRFFVELREAQGLLQRELRGLSPRKFGVGDKRVEEVQKRLQDASCWGR